jgi:hypothetical protein
MKTMRTFGGVQAAAILLVTAGTSLSASPVTSAAEGRLKLSIRGASLSADFTTTPLREVAEELGRLGVARVTWLTEEGSEPVSVRFRDVPIDEALGRIFAGRNHTVLLAKATGFRPARVWVGDVVASRRGLSAPAFEALQDRAETGGTERSEGHTEVEIPDGGARIAEIEALGNPVQLEDVLEREPDVMARAAALRRLDELGSLDTGWLTAYALDDPEGHLRHQAIELLGARAADEPAAAVTLTEIAGSDAVPFLREIAAEQLARVQAQRAESL